MGIGNLKPRENLEKYRFLATIKKSNCTGHFELQYAIDEEKIFFS